MSILQSIHAGYLRFETKNLAKLTPAERADLLAFDAAFKKRIWRNISLFVAIWLVMAVLSKLAFANETGR